MHPNSPPVTDEKLTLMSLNTQSLNSKIANLRIQIEQCSSKNCAFDIIAPITTTLSIMPVYTMMGLGLTTDPTG